MVRGKLLSFSENSVIVLRPDGKVDEIRIGDVLCAECGLHTSYGDYCDWCGAVYSSFYVEKQDIERIAKSLPREITIEDIKKYLSRYLPHKPYREDLEEKINFILQYLPSKRGGKYD